MDYLKISRISFTRLAGWGGSPPPSSLGNHWFYWFYWFLCRFYLFVGLIIGFSLVLLRFSIVFNTFPLFGAGFICFLA